MFFEQKPRGCVARRACTKTSIERRKPRGSISYHLAARVCACIMHATNGDGDGDNSNLRLSVFPRLHSCAHWTACISSISAGTLPSVCGSVLDELKKLTSATVQRRTTRVRASEYAYPSSILSGRSKQLPPNRRLFCWYDAD